MGDDDVLRTPFVVPIASYVVFVAGLITVVASVQLWTAETLYGWVNGVPVVLLTLGLLEIGLGATLFRGRLWASIAVTLCTGLTGFLSLSWATYVLFTGLYTPLQILVPLAMCVTLVVTVLTIPFCLKFERARRALLA